MFIYTVRWHMHPNLQPVHTSTAGQPKSQEPPQLGRLSLEEHLVGPAEGQKTVFTSFPEQTPLVLETLVRDRKDLRTSQENLKSQTVFLPSDLTSKLQITVAAGGLSRISLQFQFWKTKTVPLRGLGEPNNFLSSVSCIKLS